MKKRLHQRKVIPTAGMIVVLNIGDTISYEDLLGEDPDRVETLGQILNKNLDVFKKLPCDRRNVSAVSATGAT